MALQQGTREEAEAWLLGYHAMSAKLDADTWFDEYYTDDVIIQYGNLPAAQGLAVRKMFVDTFSKLDLMTHEIVHFDVVGEKIYQAASIRYLIKGDDADKGIITIPAFAVFYRRADEAGKQKCWKAEIYLDPSLVFERISTRFAVS